MTAYGIQIPITGSNAGRTLEHLLGQSDLADRVDEWLIRESIAPLQRDQIARVHDPVYVERLFANPDPEVIRTFELVDETGAWHRYDPDSATRSLAQLLEQSFRLAGGTTRGAHLALDHPEHFVFYFGGGMHHGQYDFGEGFCPVNDLVIAVRDLQAAERIRTAWIVDVDAHKGDGTAALTATDETIRTLSVHMAHGWPMDQPATLADGRPNPSHIPSDIDVPVASGEEDTYLPRLQEAMAEMERRYELPDFLLVVDGADPYERDQLPSAELLKMSADQLLARDTFLYQWRTARAIPSLFVMAGNYGYHSWEVYSQFLERQLRGELEP
jgi:acetoin utilization deacetylase AcuC-like enzyme